MGEIGNYEIHLGTRVLINIDVIVNFQPIKQTQDSMLNMT